jgi:hypothetical protein
MKKSKLLGPLLALALGSACGAGNADDDSVITQPEPQAGATSLDSQDNADPEAATSADDPGALMSSAEPVVEKAICYGCDGACTRIGPPNCGWGCCYCNGVRGYYERSMFNANVWLCITP